MNIEELKKYKDALNTSLSRDLEAFEKNFILIASGMLAFSITFIKDIVKIESACWIWLLFGGWFLILSAIGIMMFTFLSSVNSSNKLWKITDDFIVNNNLYNVVVPQNLIPGFKTSVNNEFYKAKKRLKRMRACAVILFLGGVLSFSLFVGINLSNENNKAKCDKPKIGNVDNKAANTVKKKDTIVVNRNTNIQPQHTRSN